MSAIGGIFDLNITEEIQESLLLTMKHRGKHTDAVSWQDMTLLQAGGNGTEELDWAGERYAVSFDGVLFNRRALSRELKALGHELETGKQEELLLHGYVQWGQRLPEKLDGYFAILILCQKRGKVFLARDRMGVRPLFYMRHGGGLLVASEMKTILSYPGVPCALDSQGAAQLLLLGPGRIPGSGVFAGMQEVEPGCCGEYQGGNLRLRNYWWLTDAPHEDSFSATREKVREMVVASVRKQMAGTEKIGAMLSGGLDSSAISAISARELDARGETLDTFSVDYENNGQFFVSNRFQPDRDTEYIRQMVASLDCRHHWMVLSAQTLAENLADAVVARDLPGMADVDSSLLAFCGEIRKHTPVVLSGECADEIFGGYPWYRDEEMRRFSGFPWARSISHRIKLLHPNLRQTVDPQAYVYDHYAQTIAQADILPETGGVDRRIKELVNLNFRWFMQTLIDRGDRMGSAWGLDIRMPFCDHEIAQYLYTVPWDMKDHRGREKGLLRAAMEGYLPQSVLYRKKSPYPKTYDPQYLHMVTQMLRSVLNDPQAPLWQIVDRQGVEDYLAGDMALPWYGQLMGKPQTIAFLVQINFWLERYSVAIR